MNQLKRKFFFRSLGQFFLTVCQNNFGNKIPLLLKWIIVKSITVKCKRTYSVCNSFFFQSEETCTGGKFSSWIVVSQLTPSRVLEQATQPNRSWGSFGNGWISLQTWKIHFTLEQATSSHSHQTITRFEYLKVQNKERLYKSGKWQEDHVPFFIYYPKLQNIQQGRWWSYIENALMKAELSCCVKKLTSMLKNRSTKGGGHHSKGPPGQTAVWSSN